MYANVGGNVGGVGDMVGENVGGVGDMVGLSINRK